MMFVFIETKLFTRLVLECLTDDEYRAIQVHLIEDPEAGAVIRGTGGVRKLRWRGAGRGKSGGYRIIYFPKIDEGIVWMLTLYPKNVRDTIPAHVLRKIREELDNG
jgi:mRNA-degrading endonuclease RelE of RelBE toxin-antitoxin system